MKNKKGKIRLKPSIKHFIYSFCIAIFIFLGYFFVQKGLNNKEIVSVNYKEKNSIDYKVYLKPNNFFESSFLPKDSTYISSLINYLDTDFDFNMIYDKKVSGTYTYFIRASLLANKSTSDTKSYWTKEYILKNSTSATIKNQGSFQIKENVKINYQDYNDLLTQFKKEYGLSIDGELKVELVVISSVKYDSMENPIEDTSSMYIEIPLTQLSLDIKINNNPEVKNNDVVVNTIVLNDLKHKLYLWAGMSAIIFAIVFIVCFIKSIICERAHISKYSIELNKILTTYDSIIVSADIVKDLSNYNLIEVHSFEELLDAHSEVRMPINFIELEKGIKSVFILINNNIAWIYTLENNIGEK